MVSALAGTIFLLSGVGWGLSAPGQRQIHRWLPAWGYSIGLQRDLLPGSGDLPLVLVEAAPRPQTVALFVSGAGGWADIDRRIAARLRQGGVTTVGLDSLLYFIWPRSAESAARDVERIIAGIVGRWGDVDILLIGYSVGADTLPPVYVRLTPQTRARIKGVALVGLSDTADFGVGIVRVLEPLRRVAEPTLPAVHAMVGVPLLCVLGEQEETEGRTLCPTLRRSGIRTLELSGDHHFDGRYQEIAEAILDMLD